MAVNAETTVRKIVSLPRDLVARINDFRFDARIKTESDAIRQLLEAGLASRASQTEIDRAEMAHSPASS